MCCFARNLGIVRHNTAAQVLLSACDSNNFHLPIGNLGALDIDNFEAAIAVIRGRIEFGTRPNALIENGYEIFTKLMDVYSCLKVKDDF